VNVEDVLTSAQWGRAPAHRVSLSGADVSSCSQAEGSGSDPTSESPFLPQVGAEGEGGWRGGGGEEEEEEEEEIGDMNSAGEGRGRGA